jgi:nitroreductase
MDSSEFLNFLSTRASVREFPKEPLTDEQVMFILDSAVTAPSAGNLESWDVVVVRSPEEREALSDAAYQQHHVAHAGGLFVVCANYVRSMSRYGERGILYAVQDATIACCYMMLAAHAAQLRSCWVGAFNEDEVKGLLDLPSHIRPVAILCVGKGQGPFSFTERMAVGEHVHWEHW